MLRCQVQASLISPARFARICRSWCEELRPVLFPRFSLARLLSPSFARYSYLVPSQEQPEPVPYAAPRHESPFPLPHRLPLRTTARPKLGIETSKKKVKMGRGQGQSIHSSPRWILLPLLDDITAGALLAHKTKQNLLFLFSPGCCCFQSLLF